MTLDIPRPTLLSALSVGLLAVALCGCESKVATKAVLPPPAVATVAALAADIPGSATFVGKTTATQRVELRPRVNGNITRKYFVDGDKVTEGQPLFEIDPLPYRAAVSRAAANVSAARAAARRAKAELKRSRQLFERNSISLADFQTAEAMSRSSSADVKAMQAGLRTAQLELEYTTIESPLTGRIGATTVDVGNVVNPSTATPLSTTTRLHPIYAELTVDERTLLRAQHLGEESEGGTHRGGGWMKSLDVALELADGSIYEYYGKLVFVSPEVDRSTGTFMLRALFPNVDEKLHPGLYARVIIRSPKAIPRVLIPRESIVIRQGGKFVYVVTAEGVVEERKAVTGSRWGNLVIIQEGVKADEQVIVRGVHKVRHGLKVNPTVLESITAAADPVTAKEPKRWKGELVVPLGPATPAGDGAKESEKGSGAKPKDSPAPPKRAPSKKTKR